MPALLFLVSQNAFASFSFSCMFFSHTETLCKLNATQLSAFFRWFWLLIFSNAVVLHGCVTWVIMKEKCSSTDSSTFASVESVVLYNSTIQHQIFFSTVNNDFLLTF